MNDEKYRNLIFHIKGPREDSNEHKYAYKKIKGNADCNLLEILNLTDNLNKQLKNIDVDIDRSRNSSKF